MNMILRTNVPRILALMVTIAAFSFAPSSVFAATNPALNVGGGSDTSLNWAGYVVRSGSFTSVSGSWMVPSVAIATTSQADATWIGIGGVASTDLIQVGTQEITQNGTLSYEAWYELLPADSVPVALTVHAGDSMSASLVQEQSGNWQINIQDNTTGQSYSTTVSYDSSLSSAEWIEEMPSDQTGFIPLDNFGTVSFTNASAVDNGKTITPAQGNAIPLTMITNANQALAVPSSLGANGQSFSVSRTTAASNIAPHIVRPDGRGGFRRSGSGNGLTTYRWHVQITGQRSQSFVVSYTGRISPEQSVRMFYFRY
jgi:hypothetical protein